MKHTAKVTLILISVFLLSQLVGLAIVNRYVDHKEVDPVSGETKIVYKELPLNIERPPINENHAYIFILAAVLLGTLLALVLIKYRTVRLWKVWFFLSVLLCLTIALKPFAGDVVKLLIPALMATQVSGMGPHEWIALLLAGWLAYRKIFKPTVILGNLTEVFIYGGLAAIFVPIINIRSAIILLVAISLYDMYAVWRSQHMIKLATFQRDSKVFAGLSIPYGGSEEAPKVVHAKKSAAKKKGKGKGKKITVPTPPTDAEGVRTAILGGGDIGFPMFFAGVVMKTYPYLQTLIIPICVTVALYLLLTYGKANKFYPAMPFLTFGCFIGYSIVLIFL